MDRNDTPRSRSDARSVGAKHYWTGLPCSKGHVALRHLTGTCVECQQMANRAWAERNPDEAAKRSSRWQKENPERVRAKNLRWRRKKDGLPTATRPVPIGCECCGRALESGKKTHLDHCHATGKFRGWLCNRCNLGIGALGDSTAAIERALAYLKRAED